MRRNMVQAPASCTRSAKNEQEKKQPQSMRSFNNAPKIQKCHLGHIQRPISPDYSRVQIDPHSSLTEGISAVCLSLYGGMRQPRGSTLPRKGDQRDMIQLVSQTNASSTRRRLS